MTPHLKPVQSVSMIGMDVEYGRAGGRGGHVGEEMQSLEDGKKKQRDGGDKGSRLYGENPDIVKIIISEWISRWDGEYTVRSSHSSKAA